MPPLAEAEASDIERQLELLGLRVLDARHAAGMSVNALSKASGVSEQTISRIEAGFGGVGVKNLWAVLQKLGLEGTGGAGLYGGIPSAVAEQEALPVHARHLDDEAVREAIEAAASAACERLDELFRGAKPESEGLSSNFRGLLADHLAAMLCGSPHVRLKHVVPLKTLVYNDELLGREYTLKEGAEGYLVRLEATNRVLENGKFRLARRVSDMYSSWDAAARAVRDYVAQEGHLPGPVRVVSGWWAEGEAGVRFTARPE